MSPNPSRRSVASLMIPLAAIWLVLTAGGCSEGADRGGMPIAATRSAAPPALSRPAAEEPAATPILEGLEADRPGEYGNAYRVALTGDLITPRGVKLVDVTVTTIDADGRRETRDLAMSVPGELLLRGRHVTASCVSADMIRARLALYRNGKLVESDAGDDAPLLVED